MAPQKKTPSLQDILKRRQRSDFVGREEQITLFRRNLALPLDDKRRRFIFNVTGQGGVGKTWLLRRFRQVAESVGAITAWTDEAEEAVPEVMGRIAEQFEGQGHDLEGFSERYRVYRQKRQELEADPDAPQGFLTFVGRTLPKGGVRLARRTPVGGVVFEFVDDDAFATQIGEWADYVRRRLTNKDEVRLVLEPFQVLTPLFLQDLRNAAEQHTVALFFDTYEHTGDFLDAWLRELLEGRYGEVPATIVITIAGRHELDKDEWSPFEGLIARLPLDPFTEEEARDYLNRKGITNEQVVDVVLNLSGRLPLLVATLATESPTDPNEVGDPSGEAVERLLKWVEDPKYRQIALDAALLRRINRDVLGVLAGEEADALFRWLLEMPFVRERAGGWSYNDVVRIPMLRYKRRGHPQDWSRLHGQLAEYYEQLRDDIEPGDRKDWHNEIWQNFTLEALYHRLCQAPRTQLVMAFNGFLMTFGAKPAFAHRWARTINNAGEDADEPTLRRWGEQLLAGLRAYDEDRHQEVAEMLTVLLEVPTLETKSRVVALIRRGEIYRLLGRYEDALVDFTQALELRPDDVQTFINRGLAHQSLGHYEAALDDFDQAVRLDPDNAGAVVNRGRAYRLLGRYAKAQSDFNRAIELTPENIMYLIDRGKTHLLVDRYEEALSDFNQAIALEPYHAGAITQRGETYRRLDRYEEALVDFERAIELQPGDVKVLVNRSLTLLSLGRLQDALTTLNSAIELDPHFVEAIVLRGRTYRLLGEYQQALSEFNRAVELEPSSAAAFTSRGETCRLLGRYERAISDFDHAIWLEPDQAQTFVLRAETYRVLGRYDEALTDVNRAVELRPTADWTFALRGMIYRQMGRYEEALASFDRAIVLAPERPRYIAYRGETHLLAGRYEEAVADLDRAVVVESSEDWYLYNRALAFRLLGKEDRAEADLADAIRRARDNYEQAPHQLWNTFNLALYNLAAGKTSRAETLYREALSSGASPHYVRESSRDVKDFLDLFPDHPQASDMLGLLQEQPSYAEARAFLSRAGFAVRAAEPFGFLCDSNQPLWADISPLYVRLVLERALDLEAFHNLCSAAETIYGEDLRGHAAAVVIDRPPRASDLHQIFALRAQRGFTIIPVPSSLMVQAQRDGRDMEALREQVELYTGRRDLYTISGAVTDVLSFFGRSALLANLERKLTTGRSAIIFGMRKIGKSSLLGRLQEECTWPVAVVDLEGYAGGLGYVYGDTLRAWQAALRTSFPHLSLPEWTDGITVRDPSARAQAFRQAVADLLDLLAHRPGRPGLLLFLDEVDTLFGEPQYRDFAGVLRSIAEDPRCRGRFALLMAGLEPTLNRLDRMSDGRNPLYAFFSEVPLGPLEPEAARTMIVSIGGQMEISYTEDALDFLVRIAGSHPHLIRQLCSRAIRNLDRPAKVDLDLASQVAEDYLRWTHNYLAKSLWAIDIGGPPAAEEALLRSLAVASPQSEELLIPPNKPPEERQANQVALDHLRDQSLIRHAEGGWELSIPLYSRWIRRYVLNVSDEATAEDNRC